MSVRSFLVVAVLALIVITTGATALAQDTKKDPPPDISRPPVDKPDPTKNECPNAEPDKLPPRALAGATRAALTSVPEIYGVPRSEDRYAEAAFRGLQAPLNEFHKTACPNRPKYGKLLQKRSVQVNMVFPKYKSSASLSEHWVLVARFDEEYRVWGVYR